MADIDTPESLRALADLLDEVPALAALLGSKPDPSYERVLDDAAAALRRAADRPAPPSVPIPAPDCLLWWTSAGDELAIRRLLNHGRLARWPAYLLRSFISREGRNGRGRIWAEDFLGEMTVAEHCFAGPLGAAASQCAAIVIRRADLAHVLHLPGFVTDLRLELVDPGEAIATARREGADAMRRQAADVARRHGSSPAPASDGHTRVLQAVDGHQVAAAILALQIEEVGR